MKVTAPEVEGQAGDVLTVDLGAEDHVQSSHCLHSWIGFDNGQGAVIVRDRLSLVEASTASRTIEGRIDLKLMDRAAYEEGSNDGGRLDDCSDEPATSRPATQLRRVPERITNA